MQEALRLRPPIPGLPRCAVQNCELDGFFIPKGKSREKREERERVDVICMRTLFLY